MTVAPPKPPSSAAEHEALIREARARQRRRQLLAATVVAIAAATTMIAYSMFGSRAGKAAGTSPEAVRPTCGPGCGSNLPGGMLALTGANYPWYGLYGNGLVRIDPKSLRPLQRDALRLGDAVSGEALSPDGRQIAFGGTNMGEVLFTDRSAEHVSRLTLVPDWQRHNDVQVDVLAWPRRSRLIAVATHNMAPWWAPKRSELFVIDPTTRSIVRRLPLHGSMAWSSVSLRNGTTTFVVEKGDSSRVVVVTSSGSTWSVSLRGLHLHAGKPVVADGTSYAPDRPAALVTDGRNRVFVVAADRPIGEILLRERKLRYHQVTIPRTYFAYPAAQPAGTAGVSLSLQASAVWLGGGMLAISGRDTLPVAERGGQAWNRYVTRNVEIVDTRTWHWTSTIHASGCQRDGTVFLCAERVTGRPGHGPSIVAYDLNWHRLWAAGSSTDLGWEVTAGRLLVWPVAGPVTRELDPATGHVLRRIDPVVTSGSYGGDLPSLIALPALG